MPFSFAFSAFYFRIFVRFSALLILFRPFVLQNSFILCHFVYYISFRSLCCLLYALFDFIHFSSIFAHSFQFYSLL